MAPTWAGSGLFYFCGAAFQAESMYKRAFMCDPHNSRAVASIKRTDPQVQEIYSRIYRRIDSKRALIARVPQSDPGLRRAMRESYYLHIYHTNAIEGNSLSLIQTRSILETGYVVPGKTVKEHTEVQPCLSTVQYSTVQSMSVSVWTNRRLFCRHLCRHG